MKNLCDQICVGLLLAASTSGALAQGQPALPAPVGTPIPVTADNFIRAETDETFTGVEKTGGFGKFHHYRELVPIDNHIVQRGNRDTLYATGVFDLDAGPVRRRSELSAWCSARHLARRWR